MKNNKLYGREKPLDVLIITLDKLVWKVRKQ